MKNSIKFTLLGLAAVLILGLAFSSEEPNSITKDEKIEPISSAKVETVQKPISDSAPSITVDKYKPLTSTSSTNKTENTVYKTNTGSKYHRSGCQYLKKSKISITEEKAIRQGLEPCSKCNP